MPAPEHDDGSLHWAYPTSGPLLLSLAWPTQESISTEHQTRTSTHQPDTIKEKPDNRSPSQQISGVQRANIPRTNMPDTDQASISLDSPVFIGWEKLAKIEAPVPSSISQYLMEKRGEHLPASSSEDSSLTSASSACANGLSQKCDHCGREYNVVPCHQATRSESLYKNPPRTKKVYKQQVHCHWYLSRGTLPIVLPPSPRSSDPPLENGYLFLHYHEKTAQIWEWRNGASAWLAIREGHPRTIEGIEHYLILKNGEPSWVKRGTWLRHRR